MCSRRSDDPSGPGPRFPDDTLSDGLPPGVVEEAVETYMAACRRGERPDLKAFLERFPRHAEDLEEILEALAVVEEIGQEGVERADSGRRRITADGMPLDRLGEYRIEREIGRGGMGVVYEAHQDSLGRRVALKVLPFHALADESRIRRFQAEARAVAGLTHSSIVPVFGVGQENGIHYYTMQFVEGQPLHRVLRDIRLLRKAAAERPGEPVELATASLFFGGEAAKESGVEPVSGESISSGATVGPARTGGQVDSRDRGSSTSLSDTVRLATDGEADGRYFKNVARLGLQVADALDYAHTNGVLHRDIKPSNLLLDIHGKVWVTDFGLAKVLEGDDLTHTGDVMGTLAYMAPERFRGWSDPRSDVYSLGITLYELVTLRAAFSGSDRGRLIRRITEEEPEAPRRLEPRIPRDLETIVLKAIEKEPTQRYATARDMARDLALFLDDAPIATRRSGVLERSWRWCRRNPVAASLVFLVLCLSTTALGVLSYAFLQRDEAIAADRARREATFLSMVHEASTFFRGGEGRRFESLDRLREASALLHSLTLPPDRARQLRSTVRSAVLAARVQSDLRVVRRSANPETGYDVYVCFDPERGLFAKGARDRSVRVYRIRDSAEVARADTGNEGKPGAIQFARPELLVGVAYRQGDHYQLVVCDLAGGGKRLTCRIDHPAAFHFHPVRNRLALASPGGTLEIRDTRSGDLLWSAPASQEVKGGQRISAVRYSPGGEQVALAVLGAGIEIHTPASGREPEFIPPPRRTGGFRHLSWHPGGDLLAATTGSFSVQFRDVARGRFLPPLVGHTGEVAIPTFGSDGETMLTTSWDLTMRVWDVATGRELLRTATFRSPTLDSTRSGFGFGVDGDEIVEWEFSKGEERLEITAERGEFRDVDFVLGGRILAYATSRGVSLVEARNGKRLARLRSGDTVGVRGDPASRHLVTVSPRTGVLRWPLTATASGGRVDVVVGQPVRLADIAGEYAGVPPASLGGDGRRLAYTYGSVVNLLDLETGELTLIDGGQGLTRAVLSPDARHVAGSNWGSREGRVVEVESGRVVLELGRSGEIHPAFSRDGRWLATATDADFRFYRTEDWTEIARWRRPRSSVPGHVAFFPSNQEVVVSSWPQRLTILDISGIEHGEAPLELATLEMEHFDPLSWLGFSPTGRSLASLGGERSVVWDLARLRSQLVDLGLDWGSSGSDFGLPDPFSGAVRLTVEDHEPEPLGDIALREGRFRMAWSLEVERLGRLIEATPLDPGLYHQRATAFGYLERYREAREDLLRARELGYGEDQEIACLLVTVTSALGEMERADEALVELLAHPRLEELEAWPLNNAAWAYATAPRPGRHADLAVKLADLAIRKLPGEWSLFNTRGVARYRAEDFEGAVVDFEKSLRSSENEMPAADWVFLGMCQVRQDRVLRGRELIEKAREWRREREAQGRLFSRVLAELRAFEDEADRLLRSVSDTPGASPVD